jgi:hypothetical protein
MNYSLFIATPSYEGKVTVPYLLSFADTLGYLKDKGIKTSFEIRKSSTLLPTERNILFENFYQSDATHMLCVDADMGWEAADVVSMLLKNKDIICGAYISRHEHDLYVFQPYSDDPKHMVSSNGLIRIKSIGMGFMLISRTAIQRMRDNLLQYKYEQPSIDLTTKKGYAFCDTEVRNGVHYGEDYTFCYRAELSGNEIWVDPTIKLNHAEKVGTLKDILPWQ